MAACGSFCPFRLEEVDRVILFGVAILLGNIFPPAGVRPKPKAKPSHRPIFYTDAPSQKKGRASPCIHPPGIPINDILVNSGAFESEFSNFRACGTTLPGDAYAAGGAFGGKWFTNKSGHLDRAGAAANFMKKAALFARKHTHPNVFRPCGKLWPPSSEKRAAEASWARASCSQPQTRPCGPAARFSGDISVHSDAFEPEFFKISRLRRHLPRGHLRGGRRLRREVGRGA